MTKTPWRIDVHAHPLPDFYMEAVTGAGITRSRGKAYPDWSESQLLELMDRNGILTSMLSFSTPHVVFAEGHSKRTATDVEDIGLVGAHISQDCSNQELEAYSQPSVLREPLVKDRVQDIFKIVNQVVD